MLKNQGIGKYIGNRAFYKMVLAVALPIMLQNVVSNFVSLLDNIMVGQTGTAAMSGVAVVGQLMFNYYVIIFGTVSGPGIFCAQFFGAKDGESLRASFRYKLLVALLVGAAVTVLLAFKGEALTLYFLTGEESAKAEVLRYAKAYMDIMLWGMLPFAVSSAYASTLRETGQTVVPMLGSVAAVVVNLFLNWVLIFGKLGAPAMGVVGAAVATVISRLVEMGIDVVWAHTHPDRVLFTKSVFRTFRIRRALLKDVVLRSLPLFVNEFLWSTGTSVITQVYSTKGLVVVAALNIGYVLNDLFQMAAFSIGNTIGIIVGQQLGAGETDKAVDTDRKLIAFCMVIVAVCAGLMCACAPLFPAAYNTTPEVKKLAAQLILIMAAVMPFSTLAHCSYYTLRSGGKTIVTFLFDSCFMWTVNIPVAWCAAHLTPFGILAVYALSNSTDLIKCVIGCTLVHKRVWVNNLTKVNEV